MADEPLRIKVDKNVYQQTLDSLETQLEALQSHKENLQRQLDRLNSGNTFAGSDVRSAIEKTEEVLKTVGDSISRVMGYKNDDTAAAGWDPERRNTAVRKDGKYRYP